MSRFAEAGYRVSVDDYSATFPKALQKVQDGMSSMSYMGEAADESAWKPEQTGSTRS